MKSSASKIQMTTYDDLFPSDGNAPEIGSETVQEIALSDLFPFANHPFKVLDDEAMADTAESIRKYGVLVPGIARPRAEGGYELIARHRRKRGSELAERATMPVIIRDLDDDESTIIMVDSNIQRENLLPSEKAWAYKMKLDALSHQGATCGQVGHKSREQIADGTNDSGRQIQRYVRLTELLPDLLQQVDDKKLAFNPAVELSYLTQNEQNLLLKTMTRPDSSPSLAQAGRLKKYSQDGKLDENIIDVILSEESTPPVKVTLKSDRLKQYFPQSYTQKQVEEVIFNLLETWHKQNA